MLRLPNTLSVNHKQDMRRSSRALSPKPSDPRSADTNYQKSARDPKGQLTEAGEHKKPTKVEEAKVKADVKQNGVHVKVEEVEEEAEKD